MIRTVFKFIGALMLVAAGLLLLVGILAAIGYLPRLSPSVSPLVFIARLLSVVLLVVTMGVGLLLLRKWAALGISISALYLAYQSLLTAIHPPASRPGDWNWLGYVYAIVFVIPLIVTVKYWRTLEWGRKVA